MPKVDPNTHQPLSDDPDQDDPDLAGGHGTGAWDRRDTRGPSGAKMQGEDEGPSVPADGRKPQETQSTGH